MNDRELLEMAAKACIRSGMRLEFPDDDDGIYVCRDHARNGHTWNPLTDDGDALRLAVSLKLIIIIYSDWVEILRDGIRAMNADSVYYAGCMRETTRRVITHAAAEIGRAMP